MPNNWSKGDRVKVRPIFTLPASKTTQWHVRSRYYYPGTISDIMHHPKATAVIVTLDDHEQLSMNEHTRQLASLFELHEESCECRKCTRVPNNRRAECARTRLRRIASWTGHKTLAGLSWTGSKTRQGLAWTWNRLWRPRPVNN